MGSRLTISFSHSIPVSDRYAASEWTRVSTAVRFEIKKKKSALRGNIFERAAAGLGKDQRDQHRGEKHNQGQG